MNNVTNEAAAKRWYWASAVFVAVDNAEPPSDDVLCERIVFLLQASSDAEAQALSRTLAASKEHGYKSAVGSDVAWKLKCVERVEELFDDVLTNGTEVFWQYLPS